MQTKSTPVGQQHDRDGRGDYLSCSRGLLTTEEQLVAAVGSRQLPNVLYPVAHHPGQVASVVQAPHHDAVQVQGFNEGAEQSALQPKDVPPGKKISGAIRHMGGGMAILELPWENQKMPAHGLEG